MSLCLTTVVDNEYMAYLPLFVYCANKAYPEYDIKLFLRDPCPYDLNKWGLKCEIVPMFETFPRYKYMSIALRFVVPKEEYASYDYVYVTDIDMMIMREPHDIEYFHGMEMCDTGLCYSNSLRNKNHYEGYSSLSGLHFASREWFEKTDEIATEYRENMAKGFLGTYREYDGVMLYRMAKRAGLGLPGKYRLTKRHHGIHVNSVNLFDSNRYKLEARIQMDFRVKWMQYVRDNKFKNIMETCMKDNADASYQLSQITKFCEGRL